MAPLVILEASVANGSADVTFVFDREFGVNTLGWSVGEPGDLGQVSYTFSDPTHLTVTYSGTFTTGGTVSVEAQSIAPFARNNGVGALAQVVPLTII